MSFDRNMYLTWVKNQMESNVNAKEFRNDTQLGRSQIMSDLYDATHGKKVDTPSFGDAINQVISENVPTNTDEGLAGGVAGAVGGALAGGPLGAVAGGYLGHKVQQAAKKKKNGTQSEMSTPNGAEIDEIDVFNGRIKEDVDEGAIGTALGLGAGGVAAYHGIKALKKPEVRAKIKDVFGKIKAKVTDPETHKKVGEFAKKVADRVGQQKKSENGGGDSEPRKKVKNNADQKSIVKAT